MNKHLVLFFLLSFFAVRVNAQTTEQILQKFIDSSGGADRIASIQSSDFTIRMAGEAGDTMLLRIIKQRPNRYLVALVSAGGDRKVMYQEGKAVSVEYGVSHPVTDVTTLEELWVHSNILPECAYAGSSYRIEQDTATINGILYHPLHVFSPSGTLLFTNCYHPVTGLLDLVIDRYGRATAYEGYQYRDGFRVPTRGVVINPDGTRYKIDVVEIHINTPLTDVFGEKL